MGLFNADFTPGGFLWLLVFGTAAISPSLQAHWTYTQQGQWPEVCLVGKQQSPINLQLHKAELKNFDDLEFTNYEKYYKATVVNNGHTYQLKLKNPSELPRISGGGLPHEYIFDQMHFHWGSEHTVHSNRYSLEMHLVHYASIYNSSASALASKSQDAIAVLGVLYDLSEVSTSGFNKNFISSIISVRKNENTELPLLSAIALRDFLPKDTTGFYRYEGSLTTPTCDESVVWTVFTDVGRITPSQLTNFNTMETQDGILSSNYRTIQNLNGRIVTMRLSENSAALPSINIGVIILSLLTYFLKYLLYSNDWSK